MAVAPKITVDTKVKSAPVKSAEKPALFMFSKENYTLMLLGIVVIICGFLLMIGQNNTDPTTFPAEEIYSFRRITLAPIVVLIGFGIEIVAILKKPVSQ